MATPDERRKRWRFRLNDVATLEVSSPPPATEKQVRRRGRWSLIIGTLIAALMVSAVAFASVSTDQPDYSPGSVVTISGDNSNAAGYLAGETVSVAVSGPNGYEASCEAAADENGAWSCQVTLWDNELAYGDYAYSATGTVSGVVETGTFTDLQNLNSFQSNCNTGSDSFTTGATVCMKAGGLGSGTKTVTFRWWAPGLDPSSDIPTRENAVTGTGGNLTDSFVVVACGTWNVSATRTSFTAQTDDFTVTGCAPSNADPIADAGADVSGNEGSPIELDGSASSDPDGDAITYSWSINTSGIDGGGLCSFDDATAQKPKVTCDDDSEDAVGGDFTATLMVTDPDGETDTDDVNVTVSNVLPTVTFDPSNLTSVNENADATTGQVTFSYTISDAGTNDSVDAVDTSCGLNGTKVVGSDFFTDTAGSFKCIFPDGDDPPAGTDTTLSAAASDDDELASGTADTLDVNIQNVAPDIQTAAFAMQVFGCGANNVRLDVTFTDPGADSWTATVDWGSGPESVGPVGKSFSAYHTFNSGGPYTATVVVSDDDLGVSDAFDSTNSAYVGYQSDGILQPINLGSQRSLFKYGSVVPVKLKVKDCDGNLVPDLTLRLRVQMLTSGTPNGVDEGFVSAGSANTGNLFRYDADGGQYIYNLSTKTLSTDPTSGWRLFVDAVLSTGPPEVVQSNVTTADIGLKK